MHNWERGQIPDVETVIKLCEVLDCDFDYLFGKIDLPHKEETDICRETGLSEEAVGKLVGLKMESDFFNKPSPQILTINALINSKTLLSALKSYLCQHQLWIDARRGIIMLSESRAAKSEDELDDESFNPRVDASESPLQREIINAINLQRLQTELIRYLDEHGNILDYTTAPTD